MLSMGFFMNFGLKEFFFVTRFWKKFSWQITTIYMLKIVHNYFFEILSGAMTPFLRTKKMGLLKEILTRPSPRLLKYLSQFNKENYKPFKDLAFTPFFGPNLPTVQLYLTNIDQLIACCSAHWRLNSKVMCLTQCIIHTLEQEIVQGISQIFWPDMKRTQTWTIYFILIESIQRRNITQTYYLCEIYSTDTFCIKIG